MVYVIWRLFPFRNVEEFNFLYIVAFAAIAIGLIYGIDFIYKVITKNKNGNPDSKHEPPKDS